MYTPRLQASQPPARTTRSVITRSPAHTLITHSTMQRRRGVQAARGMPPPRSIDAADQTAERRTVPRPAPSAAAAIASPNGAQPPRMVPLCQQRAQDEPLHARG